MLSTVQSLFLLVSFAQAQGTCPDATWRVNPATAKCYKIAPGYVGQGECADACADAGTSASLACVQSSDDMAFFQAWMNTEGIPGTPRKVFWIGNYKPSETAGWSQCTSGQASSYTNWTDREPQPNLPCAVFEGNVQRWQSGWYSRDCLYWYHCMCESGTGTSASSRSWYAANHPIWMAPWIAKGTWTFVVAAVLGILPGTVSILLSMSRPKGQGDWKNRVKARVSFVMRHIGWLLNCLGFAPVIAFFVGFHAVYAIGYPQAYSAFIPIGVSCWLLAIVPTNPTSTFRALVGAVIFFGAFAAVGLLAIFLWGPTWIPGLLMGVVFLLFGVTLALASAHALCSIKDARTRYRRLWACMRLFFAVLFVVSLALFLEYVLNLNSQFSENIGWVLLAISSLLCAGLTRPRLRNKFCVWLSGMSHKIGDRQEALNAAMLIWVDIDPQRTASQDDGTSMAATTA